MQPTAKNSNEPILIRVRVTAGAHRESIVEKEPGIFQISVREEAEANRANTRVREIIADRYRVPITAVRIISGHKNPSKKISIIK